MTTGTANRRQHPHAVRCRGARRPGSEVTDAPAGPWWLVLRGLARQAARATEADRGRAALLVTVSHDLRTPLAAAMAAVSGLRLHDARLTATDREELLAAAEESLDLLAHLTASLLDVSRLQAGALAVFPRPAGAGWSCGSSTTGRASPGPNENGSSFPSTGSATRATEPASGSAWWCPAA
jgi:signal transduction histidine kinase